MRKVYKFDEPKVIRDGQVVKIRVESDSNNDTTATEMESTCAEHYPDGKIFIEFSCLYFGETRTFTHLFVAIEENTVVGVGYFNPREI